MPNTPNSTTDIDINTMPLIHRDISWLSFNYRVLQEAKDPAVPLFEKIKFLGIYSSNLDEFFRVRVASLRSLIRLGKKTKSQMHYSPEEMLAKIKAIVSKQQVEFSEIYQKQIIPQLEACNIFILRPKNLTELQQEYLTKYFEEKLIEHLQPILIIKNKIRTFLVNNALYLAVTLQTSGKTNRYAVVKIPSHKFPRFIELPTENPKEKALILLDDIVRYCLPSLFPGYSVEGAHSVKMTRDAELHIEDEYSGNLIDKIRKSLAKRNIGRGTRFVYDRKIPKKTLSFLSEALNMGPEDLQPEGRYHNNFDFFGFPNFGLKHLQDEQLPPLSHPILKDKRSIFKSISKKDQLLHFPYQKYDYVIRLLEQAALDPTVTHIKIAQYRVAKNSQVISALRIALQEGKEVMVFMEVKARFDEEANLYWADLLEQCGAKVLYSLPELKVHAKLLMITRQEKEETKDYCYLGTGNFNEDTSKIYEDYGLMTVDPRITREVAGVFNYLENGIRPNAHLQHLMVGQFRMRRNIYRLIEQEILNAKNGKPASITIKLNSIQDRRMIKRLYEASNAGVKIRMIIRGICSVVPDVPKFSKNIEIISIVDRFLEHSRIYIFHNDGNPKIYLASADWMTRNLYYRIECAFPIYDKDLKQEILNFIEICWKDNTKARQIDQKQQNLYKWNNKKPWRAQVKTYEYYQNKLLQEELKE